MHFRAPIRLPEHVSVQVVVVRVSIGLALHATRGVWGRFPPVDSLPAAFFFFLLRGYLLFSPLDKNVCLALAWRQMIGAGTMALIWREADSKP